MIPKYILNFFLWGTSTFPVTGSTWNIGFSAPTGLVANDLSRATFSIFFDVDGEGATDSGRIGGELGGVAMCLLKNNIN